MYSNVMLNWLILITAGLFLLFITYKVITSFREYIKMKKEIVPQMGQKLLMMSLAKGSYEDSLNVLTHIITTHCAEMINIIELNGPDSKDYIEVLTVDVTKAILGSLSPQFKELLLFYITETYLIQFVSRLSRELIVKAIPPDSTNSEQIVQI